MGVDVMKQRHKTDERNKRTVRRENCEKQLGKNEREVNKIYSHKEMEASRFIRIRDTFTWKNSFQQKPGIKENLYGRSYIINKELK